MTDSALQSASSQAVSRSGMAIMVLAVTIVPIGDALSKSLTSQLNPFEIAFWRFGFQLIVLGLVLVVLRRRLETGPWGLILLGGATSAITLSALIGAFVTMPIATAIAIFFVEPLMLTVLSALILKEKTGWRRYLAVAVGLGGVLVVIRPSWDIFGWASLLPLLAALAFAINAIAMRKLSTRMGSLSIQFWFTLVAVILLGVGLLAFGRMELVSGSGIDLSGPWAQFVLMGALSAFTFFLFTEAFRRTPASTLAPFQYIEIVGATIVGYIAFGDFPDFWTWVGTAIILGSGLYVFHRERQASGRSA
ncbi:DMT family transporter [Devosia sp. Naph2]|uniref:DMT family transporter n=1 Tax=Devosia polycyclovorans TaxID=3345148 RepID=UPI0035D02E97